MDEQWHETPDNSHAHVEAITYDKENSALLVDDGIQHARFVPVSEEAYERLIEAKGCDEFNEQFVKAVEGATAHAPKGTYRNVYELRERELARIVLTFRSTNGDPSKLVERATNSCKLLLATPARTTIANQSIEYSDAGPESYQCSTTVRVAHPTKQRTELRSFVKETTGAWTASVRSWASQSEK